MQRLLRHAALAAAVFAIPLSLPARAETPTRTAPGAPSAAAELEEAKRHFAQGVALFNDGNFGSALVEFEACYHSHPTPGVLYNIGLSQKGLFRYVEAIESMRRYLVESPGLPAERKAEVEQLIREMKALLADVTLTIGPAGALVEIDGRPAGTAPLATIGLPAGNHTIVITAEGYRPIKKEITVIAGAALQLALRLEALPRTGKVHITASQPMSSVRIDGTPRGMAPVDVELDAGGHQIEVTAVGFLPARSDLSILAGQSRDYPVTLDPVPPPQAREKHLYEKWWFWTGGVVIAGGVAAAIAIPLSLRVQDPLVGTLSPGAAKVN